MVKRLSVVYPTEKLDYNLLLYSGDLESIPNSIASLNRLNVAQLREI